LTFRQVANGLGMTGPYFLIPILMEYLVEFYEFKGGLMIYGGICLHIFLAGLVMKDIKIIDSRTEAESFLPEHEVKIKKQHFSLELLKQPSLVIICLSMLLHFFGNLDYIPRLSSICFLRYYLISLRRLRIDFRFSRRVLKGGVAFDRHRRQ